MPHKAFTATKSTKLKHQKQKPTIYKMPNDVKAIKFLMNGWLEKNSWKNNSFSRLNNSVCLTFNELLSKQLKEVKLVLKVI